MARGQHKSLYFRRSNAGRSRCELESKESQPFGSIEFPESALKRTQRKVTGFPSWFENQTVGEGERKTPASTEQPLWA